MKNCLGKRKRPALPGMKMRRKPSAQLRREKRNNARKSEPDEKLRLKLQKHPLRSGTRQLYLGGAVW